MDQLIQNVDNIIYGFVHSSFGNLSSTVSILWHLMFVVFIAIYGYKIMISGQFSMSNMMTHCFRIVLLFVFATQWDVFFQFVYRMATEAPSDIAGHMIHAASNTLGDKSQIDTVATANAALSNFYDRAMATCEKLLEGAGINHWELYLYAAMVWLGTIAFTGYALMLIILAKLAIALLLAVAPIFILLFIFNNTRNLFEGWLKTLIGFALIPIFVYALLALLLALAEAPLRYMEQHSGIYDKVMTSIGPFLLISFISILLLSQIMKISSSVTSGMSLSTFSSGAWARNAARQAAQIATTWGAASKREFNFRKTNTDRKNLGRTLNKRHEVTS